MGSPGLDTASRACRSVFSRAREMAPPSAPYFTALSSKMETSRRSLSPSPSTVTPSATWYSRGFPASKATGSKARAQSSATSDRETSARTAGWDMWSARARVSISSTRFFICRDSERMLSVHRAGRSSRGRAERSSALDKITVRGVFSSWEASERNCFCWPQARSTGAVAHRARMADTAKSSKNAARAMRR